MNAFHKNAQALIDECHRCGVELKTQGRNLCYRPPEKLSHDLKRRLSLQKSQLVKHLKLIEADEETPTPSLNKEGHDQQAPLPEGVWIISAHLKLMPKRHRLFYSSNFELTAHLLVIQRGKRWEHCEIIPPGHGMMGYSHKAWNKLASIGYHRPMADTPDQQPAYDRLGPLLALNLDGAEELESHWRQRVNRLSQRPSVSIQLANYRALNWLDKHLAENRASGVWSENLSDYDSTRANQHGGYTY